MPRTDGTADNSRQARGAAAEALAERHLSDAGLSLMQRNVRYPFGEIDLVMRERDTTVFVEVRYRGNDRFGGGAVSVDRRKRMRLVRAAQAFLLSHPPLAKAACRFDVVSLSGPSDTPDLEWIRDAFTLDDA